MWKQQVWINDAWIIYHQSSNVIHWGFMIEWPESNRRNQWLNHHFITVESTLNHNELIWSAYNEHTLTPRSIMEWFKQVSHFLQSTRVPTRPFFNQRGVGVRSLRSWGMLGMILVWVIITIITIQVHYFWIYGMEMKAIGSDMLSMLS